MSYRFLLICIKAKKLVWFRMFIHKASIYKVPHKITVQYNFCQIVHNCRYPELKLWGKLSRISMKIDMIPSNYAMLIFIMTTCYIIVHQNNQG